MSDTPGPSKRTLIAEFADWWYGDDSDDEPEIVVRKVLELLNQLPEERRAVLAGFRETNEILCTYHSSHGTGLCHNPLDCDLVTLYRRVPGSPGLSEPVSKRHT